MIIQRVVCKARSRFDFFFANITDNYSHMNITFRTAVIRALALLGLNRRIRLNMSITVNMLLTPIARIPLIRPIESKSGSFSPIG